jgi:hypothetical protein
MTTLLENGLGDKMKSALYHRAGNALWFLRELHASAFGQKGDQNLGVCVVEYDSAGAEKLIRARLTDIRPFMATRFGTVELDALRWAVYKKNWPQRILDFIRQDIAHWDFPEHIFPSLENNAGFFPANHETLQKFLNLHLEAIDQIDILASWQKRESFFENRLSNAKRIHLGDLGPPVNTEHPWTELLEGQRVLVIHPFEQTILHQYARREMIFSNPKTLPAFELITLKAVQSVANSPTGFTSWFDALDWMKSQINQTEFDIALIGCGAYGMPLAAHVKMLGKKAIHFGGSLQLLFGIKGKRWDEWKHITDLYNDYWIRPLPSDHPSGFQKVEEGCYW